MKILFVNKYFYARGGCEYVFFDTVRLCERHGHQTAFFSMRHPRNVPSRYESYFASYNDYEQPSMAGKLCAAAKLLYNLDAKHKIEKLLDVTQPDIAHIHNIYHQISPSILHSIKKRGIPIVMTAHDFKMVCPSYGLDDGRGLCFSCANGKFHNCYLKKCMKGSSVMSGLVTAEMYLHHSLMRVYDLVDVCIAPSMFLKTNMRRMGFDRTLIHVPNFIFPDEWAPQLEWKDNAIVYFGRLVAGKGLETLIDAVLGLPDVRLKIIGEGPLRQRLEERSNTCGRISFLGYRRGDDLRQEVRSAKFAVYPSECFENYPRAIIEAFALGKPVVASDIGGIPELVQNGKTGFLFAPGSREGLADAINRLYSDDRALYELGAHARAHVETCLNSEIHYEKLMQIYRQALGMSVRGNVPRYEQVGV